jgi:rhodanese-related sulfurtransferase
LTAFVIAIVIYYLQHRTNIALGHQVISQDDLKQYQRLPTIDLAELKQIFNQDLVLVIDVRDHEYYTNGHIHGSINSPEDTWQSLPADLFERIRKSQTVVAYGVGPGDQTALRFVEQQRAKGIVNVRAYPGGWIQWANGGGQTVGK